MAKLVKMVYGYELRVGDSIATKTSPNGRVVRSVEVVSIDPPSLREGGHRHPNHIHVNMGEGDGITGCWDMFSLLPLAVEMVKPNGQARKV